MDHIARIVRNHREETSIETVTFNLKKMLRAPIFLLLAHFICHKGGAIAREKKRPPGEEERESALEAPWV